MTIDPKTRGLSNPMRSYLYEYNPIIPTDKADSAWSQRCCNPQSRIVHRGFLAIHIHTASVRSLHCRDVRRHFAAGFRSEVVGTLTLLVSFPLEQSRLISTSLQWCGIYSDACTRVFAVTKTITSSGQEHTFVERADERGSKLKGAKYPLIDSDMDRTGDDILLKGF